MGACAHMCTASCSATPLPAHELVGARVSMWTCAWGGQQALAPNGGVAVCTDALGPWHAAMAWSCAHAHGGAPHMRAAEHRAAQGASAGAEHALHARPLARQGCTGLRMPARRSCVHAHETYEPTLHHSPPCSTLQHSPPCSTRRHQARPFAAPGMLAQPLVTHRAHAPPTRACRTHAPAASAAGPCAPCRSWTVRWPAQAHMRQQLHGHTRAT